MSDKPSGEGRGEGGQAQDVVRPPAGESSRNINDYIGDAERALKRMGDYACDDLDALNALVFLCGVIEGVHQATKLRLDTKAV